MKRVRYERGGCACLMTDGKADYSFFSKESIAQGAAVAVEGEAKEGRIDASVVVVLSGDKAEQAYNAVTSALKESVEMPDGPSLVKDDITEKLWPAIKEAALELICAKKLGRNVLLRFHGDADGISGAFALTDVIRCKAFQQNAAIYNVRDALRDISTAGQEGRPLVVLLDFASNDDSVEGVGLLTAAGMDVLIIDHHPPGERAHKKIVNPLLVAEDSSDYTAGYLACEVAIACGLDAEKGHGLAKVACTGDKSTLIEHDEEDERKAMVLDFLAAHTSFGNNLDFYKKVMKNESLFLSISQQAKESIEEAADRAGAGMKRTKGRVEIVTFQLDGVVRKGEWPPAGKITTCIFERLKGDAPLLCIGHKENSLIMRLNDAAVALGLSANDLAKGIVKSMPDFVIGGGGHAKAGAIRVKPGFAKYVLGELMRRARGE